MSQEDHALFGRQPRTEDAALVWDLPSLSSAVQGYRPVGACTPAGFWSCLLLEWSGECGGAGLQEGYGWTMVSWCVSDVCGQPSLLSPLWVGMGAEAVGLWC